MAAEETLKERLYAYLTELNGVASAEQLAQEALGLIGARGPVAEKVVGAAIDGDARFARTAQGAWRLKPRGKGTPLGQLAFVCVGLYEGVDAEGNEHIELAARRVQLGGCEAIFPAVRILRSDAEDAVRAFVDFADGATLAVFRLPPMRKRINRLTRIVLGKSGLSNGVCLFRLGRRFYPDRLLSDLSALATAMGIAFVANRSADGDASLQGEILLRLLAACQKGGLNTLEAVMADLYPDPEPIHFDAYAFDETFLRELPETPGVYIMRDRNGRVIYVGKAVNLRNRVGSYFARRSERAEKTQRILERIWSMEIETVGSELEALLLEARLIALCSPEFNTQVKVHDRPADMGSVKRWVLILPSVESDCVELFFRCDGGPLGQLRVRQDLRDWDDVSDSLRHVFFGISDLPGQTLSASEKASCEIALNWLMHQKDQVNFVDMEALGNAGDALRAVSEYAQQCPEENWEKVVWRV